MTPQSSANRNSATGNYGRAGFTLLELMIVVVILAIAAGLTVPLIQRSFTSQRVEKAANLVRGAMNNARNRSMRTGEVYAFYYFPQSRDFRVAPFDNTIFQVLRRRNADVESGSNFDFDEERLPQGIVFLSGDVQDDARSESVEAEADLNIRNVTPVLFYPDGTSQTAKILLQCDDSYAEIQLRGLTGSSRNVPVDESRAPRR